MYTGLVLSGGGYKGLCQLGVLHYLDEKNLISDIQEYCGTSVGAIICTLLSVGYSHYDIYNFAVKENILKQNNTLDISSIFFKWGVVDLDGMMDKIQNRIYNKIGTGIELSFKELYKKTGKKINICFGDIDNCEMVYASVDSTPDMNCMDALKYSCNIPLVFQTPSTESSIRGIDGGFGDHFPLQHLINKNVKGIIGIQTKRSDKNGTNIPLFDYLLKTLMFSIMQLQNINKKRADNPNNLIIELEDCITVSIMDLITSETVKRNLFMNGYNFTKEYFNSDKNNYKDKLKTE